MPQRRHCASGSRYSSPAGINAKLRVSAQCYGPERSKTLIRINGLLTIAGLGPFLGLAADTDWGATIFLRACFRKAMIAARIPASIRPAYGFMLSPRDQVGSGNPFVEGGLIPRDAEHE